MNEVIEFAIDGVCMGETNGTYNFINSIEGSPPGINLAWKLMPGGVPFLGVYLLHSLRSHLRPAPSLRFGDGDGRKEGSRHASSPSNSGKTVEKPSVIHTRR